MRIGFPVQREGLRSVYYAGATVRRGNAKATAMEAGVLQMWTDSCFACGELGSMRLWRLEIAEMHLHLPAERPSHCQWMMAPGNHVCGYMRGARAMTLDG